MVRGFEFTFFCAKAAFERISTNEKIRENVPVIIKELPKEEALKLGAIALFEEKYGDVVRVVIMDENYSVELCGGTHVKATGEIGYFKLIAESAVAAGVRRIEAITADNAENYLRNQIDTLRKVKELLNNPKDVVKGLETALEETAKLRKQLDAVMHEKAQQIKNELLTKVKAVNGVNLIVEQVDLPGDSVKNISFELKNQIDNLVCLIGSNVDGKPSLSLIIAENLVAEKSLNATNIIRDLAKEIQGGGGGQPFYATAGGKNAEGLKAAMEKGKSMF